MVPARALAALATLGCALGAAAARGLARAPPPVGVAVDVARRQPMPELFYGIFFEEASSVERESIFWACCCSAYCGAGALNVGGLR